MAPLTHLQHSCFVEPFSSYVYEMDQQVPASVVKPILQPHRRSDFAGSWTEQNFVGNKPMEIPRLPRNETPRIKNSASLDLMGTRGCGTIVDASKLPKENAVTAAVEDKSQGKTTAKTLLNAALKQDSEAAIHSKRLNSIVNQKHLLGQVNLAREQCSTEIFQRQQSLKSANADVAIRRVDKANILSSSRSANHSSRSLCQTCLLHERFNKNPPHVLPQPPGSDGIIHILKDEILFPGNTNRLPQLKIGNSRTEHLSQLSKEPLLSGLCRETRSFASLGVRVSRVPTSLPTSPCSSSIEFIRAWKRSKESHASKLLRKLKLTGASSCNGASVDTKAGRRNSSSRGFEKLSKEKGLKSNFKPIVSQHQNLVQRWESQMRESRNHVIQTIQDFDLRVKYAPTIPSECMKVDGYNSFARPNISTQLSVLNQEGNAASLQERSIQTRGSGSKSSAKMTSKRVARLQDLRAVNLTRPSSAISGAACSVSPTANITSGAGASLYTKSERFVASGRGDERRGSGTRSRHRRRSSWGCASRASTAVLTSESLPHTARNIPRSRFPNDNGVMESSQVRSNVGGSRVSRFRGGGSQSCRIEEAYRNFQESFQGVGGYSFRSVGGHSFRSVGGYSFRSIGRGGGQSFRKDQVFEDCHENFGGIGSSGSCGSFRSLDSLSMKSVGGSNSFSSVEDTKWNIRLPPPLLGKQKPNC